MKIKRLDKLPKRKVTVDELLGHDDVAQCISDLIDAKDRIDNLFVCYEEGGSIHWRTNGMMLSRLIYVLEVVKLAELNKDD